MGAVPLGLAPTEGLELATRLIPNWLVPVVELHPLEQAVMVLAPEVRVVPVTTTVIPAEALVPTKSVLVPVAAELVDNVPNATELDPKLKLIVWLTEPETDTALLAITTVVEPLSAIVPPKVML